MSSILERIGAKALNGYSSEPIKTLPDFHEIVPRLPHQDHLDEPFPFNESLIVTGLEKKVDAEATSVIGDNEDLEWC